MEMPSRIYFISCRNVICFTLLYWSSKTQGIEYLTLCPFTLNEILLPLNYNYPHISSCWIFSHFLSLPPNFLLATFPFTHKLFRTDEWNRECLDVDCSFLVYHNNPISISRNMDNVVSFYIIHDIFARYEKTF